MIKDIKLKPIGIIHTPYRGPQGMPIQGTFDKKVKGTVRLFPEYRKGLKDVEGFSHLILIYHFHRSPETRTVTEPFLEDQAHGIFAVRSPYRPNHIGFSVVKLESVKNGVVTFSEVDMLDGTPLLDIKPYVAHFDRRQGVRNGWIGKHFPRGRVPQRVWLKR